MAIRTKSTSTAAKTAAVVRKMTSRATGHAAKVELLVQQMEAARVQAKSLYAEADRLEAELLALIGSEIVTLSDGRTATVQNNFLDKHGQPKLKAVGIAMVKQFEVCVK